MKEKEGFVTKFKIPTILDSKMTFFNKELNKKPIDKKQGSQSVVITDDDNTY